MKGYSYTRDGSNTHWIESNTPNVSFSDAYVVGSSNIPYWYIPGESNVVDEDSGKTYEATYTFVCSGYYYTAITKFKFSKNGVVTIYSTSDDHDSGEKSCSEDLYDPIFGSKKGKTGSYTIQGNRVTISVNGVTFELEITNVLTVNELNVTKTSLSKDEQGFFSVDTLFTLQ